MKVCITGGSGFIGTNLHLHFQATEPDTEVIIVDTVPPQIELGEGDRYIYADIRNLSTLMTAFEGCDEVYHLAGILGTSELLSTISLATEVNVTGTANVFDAARRTGVKRVYNVAKPHFDSLHENAYTLTKNAGELVGKLYRDKFGMNVSTVRWLNAVGPYQHLFPVRKLVPCAVLFAMHGVDIDIYGNGLQTIDPIDARDMARFTVYACRHLNHGDVLDLGSGSAINCNEAAQIILDEVRRVQHTASKIVNVPMRDGEKEGVNLVADMTHWNSLGMYPDHPFRSSVRSVIKWMQTVPAHTRFNALSYYGKTAKHDLAKH